MLENRLLFLSFKVADMVIEQIERLPDGLCLFANLPRKGRKSASVLRKRLAHILLSTFFPPAFLQILLLTCLLPSGMPNPTAGELYQWLLHYVYCDSETKMYQAWLAIPLHVRTKETQ